MDWNWKEFQKEVTFSDEAISIGVYFGGLLWDMVYFNVVIITFMHIFSCSIFIGAPLEIGDFLFNHLLKVHVMVKFSSLFYCS